jgi:3-deoxy-D-manno-octulosonic-acid transferase
MMRWLYTLGILIYSKIIQLVSPFNDKANKWYLGRKNQSFELPSGIKSSEKWIWFHAASLGEFEQGRPLIESIKNRFPEKKILLTFFSPSGYEVRKNYELADKVAYLPCDTPSNAKKILKYYRFEAVFFIKYEFWFNLMNELHLEKIPIYFISAKFRKSQHFFQWYGFWFRQQLKKVDQFFVQDKPSAELLQSIDIKNFTITGDTRFDRVFRLSQQAKRFPKIDAFVGNKKVFVVGSSWPNDENLLFPVIEKLNENFVVILAPHDISEKHLLQIESRLSIPFCRYSDFTEQVNCKILIINNIGILSQLYQYASFAYVGGGFGQAIHNIQEAVAYGCPVMIGPNHKNFTEAVDLIRAGGVFEVTDSASIEKTLLQLVSESGFREKASSICRSYVTNQIGATESVMQLIFK